MGVEKLNNPSGERSVEIILMEEGRRICTPNHYRVESG
jgi:hypothetical protein